MVTFDLEKELPARLKPNVRNQWEFKAFDIESRENGDYLLFDTHFNGFTVLNSPKEDDHDFEYFIHRRII